MAEGEEAAAAASTSSNRERAILCEECNSNPSKYKCPGCGFRSCNLICVKAHKQRSGCTGKRDQTQFIPISKFNDDVLISDYNLLEEVKRIAESSQRLRKNLCRNTYRLPHHLKSLRSAASNRRTKILFLPHGMTKREKNQTRYDQSEKTIFWTIEWRFNSTDIVIVDHGVDENTTLSAVLKNHLQPGPWKHKLQKFCEADRLKLFIRKYPKGAKSPFRELNSNLPIRQLFSNFAVLEYPVIQVFLPPQTPDFEVIKDANTELKNIINNDHVIPVGVPFKLEEIDDDDDDDSWMDPQVLDLMKPSTSTSLFEVNHQNMPNATYSTNFMGNLEAGYNSQMGKEPGEGLEFEFEQDLIDSYSNIMAQINPDDFLDWEGAMDLEMEESVDLLDAKEVITVDELEEGEIVE